MPEPHDEYLALIDQSLSEHLPQSHLPCAEALNEALLFAVFPGGKRLRPLLTLLAARASGGRVHTALPAACAIEFLHTSSLIFDDLPAMDNAHLRRGNPALHLVFGEDMALLAALALLNQAYALFGRWPALLTEAVHAIGVNGMIGGQSVDLSTNSGNAAVPFAARNRKTSALMRLTLVAGAIGAGADSPTVGALACAGECLGEAYQVCDDLSDAYLDSAATGKTERQDARNGRPSQASEFAANHCGARALELVGTAKESLRRHFEGGAAADALIDQIDAIIANFQGHGLVMA